MPAEIPDPDMPTVRDGEAGETYAFAPPEPDVAGQRFGAYQIIREIGRGGMGTVYLAGRADDQFKKRVALKILRGAYNTQEVLRRFRHERQILAALDHPNIASLLDGGSTPSGEPYFVMDFVEGMPLDRYCDSHHLSIAERVALFRQVCSAVQYVHQNLIVHRDLKPGNILVTADGVPKLLDFGIAKILKPEMLMTVMDVTSPDARVMTPAYGSPEQVRGDPITTASDVYSLGVILYELLTGVRPYRVKTASPHELSRAICEEDPDKPSTAVSRVEKDTRQPVTTEEISRNRASVPEKLRRNLEGDLDNILLKAIRKDPQRRYSSVAEFSEDLRCHLASLPVSAHPDTFGYRARKFIRRNRIPVAAGALAVLSLIVGMTAALMEARVTRRERARAESRFQDVRDLATTFLFDVHDAIQNLAGSTPARVLIARTGTQYLDRLSREAQGDVSLERDLAEGYLKIGDLEGSPFSANLGNSAKAIEDYRKALALAAPLAARNPKDTKVLRTLALSHLELAGILPFQDRAAEAPQHAGEAIRILDQLAAQDPSNVQTKLDDSRAWEVQGDILGGMQAVNQGKPGEARAAYERSLALIPELPASDPLWTKATRARAVMIAKLGDLQERQRDIRGALAHYSEALRIAEDLARADATNRRSSELLAAVLNKAAFAQQNLGDRKAAEQSYRRALEIDEAGIHTDPTNARARSSTAVTEKNLGNLYFYELHNKTAALECYRRASELLDAASQADPGNLAWRQRLAESLSDYASVLLETGQKEEARRQARRSLQIAKELADRPNANQELEYNYAWLAVNAQPADLQDPQGALPYALKAVEMSNSGDEFSLHVLAQAYAGIGDYRKAVEAEEKAVALFHAVAPGQPKPDRQQTMERVLNEFREKLRKSGAK